MFCLNYYPSEKYIQEAEEFKIEYRPSDRTLQAFLQKYVNKSIVIDVHENFEELDAKLFSGLREKYKNFKLIIDFTNKEHLKLIQENNLPFFFRSYVATIDQLHGLLPYHPTDMYICEELGFNLEKVSKLLHDKGIQVRVLPNICQSSFPDTPSLKTFFIRPEDISTYAQYVDVFELFSDQLRQPVIFKVYKQEKWFGKIQEIIPSFKGELDSRFLLSSFGIIRSKCGKRCMYNPESCSICDRFVDLADTFEQNGIIIRQRKED